MKNIIFIDDENDILEYFEFCIADMKNCAVKTFDNHPDAAKYVNTHKIDYLFIDWRMPDGTAYDFLTEQQEQIKTAQKTIVTGELELEDEIIDMVDQVIYKPFKSNDIQALLV